MAFKCHQNLRTYSFGILDAFKVTVLFQSSRSQNKKELSIVILVLQTPEKVISRGYMKK